MVKRTAHISIFLCSFQHNKHDVEDPIIQKKNNVVDCNKLYFKTVYILVYVKFVLKTFSLHRSLIISFAFFYISKFTDFFKDIFLAYKFESHKHTSFSR